MSPILPAGESELRYKFLRNYLKFFHGISERYWQIETHPKVHVISLNEEKDSAQVYFRLGDQGGEIILGKENNKWKIVDHYMTWVDN